MSQVVSTSLSAARLGKAERRVLIAAVTEALANSRPDIPREEVRAEILADIEALERQVVALLRAERRVSCRQR